MPCGRGLIAAATAVAFYEVGEFTEHNPNPFTSPDKYFENVAGHALVGCASAEASGGKCGPAALAGGITSAAGPFINGKNFALNVVSNAVLGGAAAVAGGGKFENGAVTGAFAYLFNGAAGRAVGGFVGGLFAGLAGVESGPGDLFAILAGHYGGGEIGSRIEDALFGGESGSSISEGTKVLVWGDDAGAWGRSWTTVDPRTVPDYRDAAGLPDQNTGRFLSEGVLRRGSGS
jgi:hypothetical protein